jgi:surface protein
LDVSYLFNECINLKYLPNLSKWNLRNVVKNEYMFDECKSLKSQPELNFGMGCVGQ